MARGIFKKVEGVIALIIFISFIIFYLNFVRITLFNSEKYFETDRKFSIADDIFNQLKKEGYIISFRIYMPSYSRNLLCNISIKSVKKDFCEKIPFFVPLNLSFLLKYDGVVNNTYDTLLKKDLGVFLYLNLSEFVCEEKNDNIIIEVVGPIVSPKIIFLSTPTLYYWLKNNENILVLSNEFVNFEYCYLLSNGSCFDRNTGNSYGIIIKINNLLKEKVYFNISKSDLNKAKSFSISNLTYTTYRIVYEPKCYKDINFIILENLSFNFQNYTDLICTDYYMINFNNRYNYLIKELERIYSNLSFYKENYLYNSRISNVGPACIQHYNTSREEILNVYRVLFSNTSWFLELAEYNLSFKMPIDIFDWSDWRFSGFYADYYFNFTNFIKDDKNQFFIDKILLENKDMSIKCKYVLIFLETIYNINIYFKEILKLYLKREADYYILKPRIHYYCLSEGDEQIAKEIYYSYSIPSYEISYINKINYVDIKDIKDSDLVAYYLVNKNISIGDKNNKYYSKSYYTYLKINNSLFEDYLVIYIK